MHATKPWGMTQGTPTSLQNGGAVQNQKGSVSPSFLSFEEFSFLKVQFPKTIQRNALANCMSRVDFVLKDMFQRVVPLL